ncbi:CRISPR-associated endoribonuclease Cas6 [Hazenella sp. IB182353]|uniref:CRISPR-associated endoribonuclease Cas6 n=1 Tax=Polycladospora coralii TaxID=2771432 RepID=UPI001745D04F|nr:CRISPR-associated endoribonuclease Cas6 [Polycladospora coralii]MBS7530262.1 CRISPR-associated endoribonuclease Cas6 [Polycladospora coralii]
MGYDELTVTVMVREDLYYQNVQAALGSYLNRSMLQMERLKQRHAERASKLYVFSGLYPVERKTKIYRKGAVYIFRVRSLDSEFLELMEKCIRKQKDAHFECLAIEKHRVRDRMIQELYSITPFIVTVNNQPWLQPHGDIDVLIERLESNAEKKYQDAFQNKLDSSHFIERIELINEKPLAISYKGIRLLGNKVRIAVASEPQAQKLAYTALGAGLGEKGSSVGAGFCFANFS